MISRAERKQRRKKKIVAYIEEMQKYYEKVMNELAKRCRDKVSDSEIESINTKIKLNTATMIQECPQEKGLILEAHNLFIDDEVEKYKEV